MKNLIKTLFAITLCFPLTLSAQWTDSGPFTTTNDNVTIGSHSQNHYPFIVSKYRGGWQGLFSNEHTDGTKGANIYLSNANGYGMYIKSWSTIDGRYALRLDNKNEQTNIFYNNGNVKLGLVGNVDIGKTTENLPTAKLRVISSGNERGISSYSDHGDSHFPWSNGSAYISGESIIFRIVNSAKMILADDGNVGIGTLTPDNKLEVNGTIRTKEIIVEEDNWPDYVFYDDYDLPTLKEEEKHIEANGHLLGFESEEDMEGEIQLGDVTKRQQVKIEEVVLHLIKMEKKIGQLEKENQQLKEQMTEK